MKKRLKGKIFMKGAYAFGEAAIVAGCAAYFAYPITPQTEVAEYMSARMIEEGRVFLQAESELAAINMVFGAAGTGARVLTSSSSPGVSLKQEGLSYIATAELPMVIMNANRGGPGLGNIAPSQEDYFQATKGGGHGNYRLVVYAPSSVQELVDYTYKAFDVSQKFRNPVMILADGLLVQMMEPVTFDHLEEVPVGFTDWGTLGFANRGKTIDEINTITTIDLDPVGMGRWHVRLLEKYERMKKELVEYEEIEMEDAEVVIVAYGTPARTAMTAVSQLREKGMKVGLLRAISLFPFPEAPVRKLAQSDRIKKVIVLEMNMGEMWEDVRLCVAGRKDVIFYGTLGGTVFTVKQIVDFVEKYWDRNPSSEVEFGEYSVVRFEEGV